ncbi:DUF2878 domain-containing protein [Chlamydiales bacterium]|nr:DUF2878 domain-containing protein [Chlamydiales bacterium]
MIWKIVNFTLFYVGWYACIWAASVDRPLIGILILFSILALDFVASKNKMKYIFILFSVLTIGMIIDSLYQVLGIIIFKSNLSLFPNGAPFWILSLYALFATTINSSLSWLKGRPVISGLIGLIGVPFCYKTGELIGAATFPLGLVNTMIIIGVVWAFLLPFIFWYAKKIDQLWIKLF